MWLKEDEISRLSKELFSLRKQNEKRKEQYNHLQNKEGVRGTAWKKEIEESTIQIDKLDKELTQVKAREFRGIVLCPNYYHLEIKELEVGGYRYEPLLYSDIYNWLKKNASEELENDPNFMAFHDAMKKHKYETKSEALYEDMKTRFYSQIQQINNA